jgi:hypothetical protein
MTRLKKTIRNLLLIAILLFLFMKLNGLYFSPVKALHTSERDLHYGPSEIVHSFDHGNSRYFLTRYEDFISCSPIDRFLGVFWRYGAGHGIENNLLLFHIWQEYRIGLPEFGTLHLPRLPHALRNAS